MKILLQQILLPLLLLSFQLGQAQNIGIGTATPHGSAKLEVQSQNSGVLLPRMNSAQRKSIASPAKGLLLFDTDKNAFMFWSGSEWQILIPANASNGKAEEILNPGDAGVNNFGYEVAISGNFAAVGALHNTARRVFIYEKTAEGWLQRQEITCPDSGGNFFGSSIDMDGDCLVIGDFFWKNIAGTYVGKIFIYKRINNSYVYEAGLQSTSISQSHFAYDVAVSQSAPGGLTIAVGMPQLAGGGRVLLYRKVNNAWTLLHNIQPLNGQANDHAGFSVDLDAGILAFGAPAHNDYIGKAYLYEYNTATSNWQHAANFTASVENGLLGHSVSVSGGWVAFGRPVYAFGTNGAVLLYKKNAAGSWINRWIYEPNGLAGESRTIFFGKNVKLEGDYLLVGAASSSLDKGTGSRYGNESGKAILHKLRMIAQTTIEASVQRIMQAEFSYFNDYFAESVGISQGNIIIGHQHRGDVSSNIRGSVLFSSYDEP